MLGRDGGVQAMPPLPFSHPSEFKTHLSSLSLDTSEITNAAGQGTHHWGAFIILDGLSQLHGLSQRLSKASVAFAIGYITNRAGGGWLWLMWFIYPFLCL